MPGPGHRRLDLTMAGLLACPGREPSRPVQEADKTASKDSGIEFTAVHKDLQLRAQSGILTRFPFQAALNEMSAAHHNPVQR